MRTANITKIFPCNLVPPARNTRPGYLRLTFPPPYLKGFKLLWQPLLAAVYDWGVLGYATTKDISCCYSLPMVMIQRRTLATTAVRSLQQQWQLPANLSLHHNTISVFDVFIAYQAVLPYSTSKNPEDGGTMSLPPIPVLALSFPQRDSSLPLAACLRWSMKRLAPQPLPISTKSPSRYFSFSRAWSCSNTANPQASH